MTRLRRTRTAVASLGSGTRIAAIGAAAAALALALSTSATYSAFTSVTANEHSRFASASVFAPRNVEPPTISGEASEGKSLTVDPGTWKNDPSFRFQWQRCDAAGDACADIPSATERSYLATGEDVGHALRVRVTAGNQAGEAVATTSATPPVAAAELPPANLELPQVTGTAREGSTLSATDGTWARADDYAYQWLACEADGSECEPIAGASDATYRLTEEEIGHTIRVAVTASNEAGSETVRSAPTAEVSMLPFAGDATVTGTAKVGETLTAESTWNRAVPSLIYQWQRCDTSGANCSDIEGARTDRHQAGGDVASAASTYILRYADIGKTIRVRATASNDLGSGVAASLPTSTIAGVPFANTTFVDQVAGHDMAARSVGLRLPGAVSGAGSYGVLFNGTSSWAWRSNPAAPFNIRSGSFTIESWVNATTGMVVGRYECGMPGCNSGDGDGAAMYWLYMSQGKAIGTVRADNSSGGTQVRVTTEDPIGLGWHQVAMVLDRSLGTLSIYVDGELSSATAIGSLGPVNDGGSPLTMGYGETVSGGGPGDLLEGSLDEVAIYPKALTPTRVQAHFEQRNDSAAYRATVMADGPAGYWRLDE